MMITINNEMFNSKLPYTNIEYFNSLNENDKNNYLKLYSLYNELLYCFLIKKLELKKYDDTISNSFVEFVKVDEKNMDIYQYLSSNNLNFLYVHNNIYIERLTTEEINKLLNFSNNYNSEEALDFINSTYKKVIFESNEGTTMYGPDNLRFIKPSNGIIIGLRHNAFFIEENENEDNWKNKYEEKERYLNLFIPELERQLNNKGLGKVFVIEYNDFSIKIK